MYKLLVEADEGRPCVSKLSLYFAEDDVTLPYDVEPAEEERLRKLLAAVYRKIIALDFPSTEGYEKNIKGVIAFEDDLIEGRI